MTYLYKCNDQVFIVVADDVSEACMKLRYLTRTKITKTDLLEINDAVVITYDNQDGIDYEVLD